MQVWRVEAAGGSSDALVPPPWTNKIAISISIAGIRVIFIIFTIIKCNMKAPQQYLIIIIIITIIIMNLNGVLFKLKCNMEAQ